MNYSSNPAQDLATLIQGQALNEWQIYKALHAAIQHRGYKHSDYKDHETENTENAAEALDDAKENYEAVQEYEKAGGGYKGGKGKEQKLLEKWGEEKWSTKDEYEKRGKAKAAAKRYKDGK